MSKKDTTQKTEQEKTDFQGPVSLEAILAATSKPTVDDKNPSTTAPIKQPVKKEEEEEVVVVKKPEDLDKGDEGKEDTTTVQTPAPTTTGETESYKTAKRLISLGLLEDFTIQTSEEDTEGTPISEFTEMSEENLEEIIKIHKQESENNISSNYISKEGIREHELKVIEILKNGGDLSKIAKTEEEAFKRPFEGFDMDDQKRQIDVRYTDLVHQKGLDHDSAITIIDKEVKSGAIEAKAKEVFDSYREAHAKYIDGILQEQKKEKEFKDLNFKENKKALTAKLKEAGLKESVYKKVTSEYAKKNENGEYVLVDKLREALNSPEENHELILHLADKALFNETFKIKAAQESQKTIVRLASGASSKGNRQATKTGTQEQDAPWLVAANKYNESIKQ